MNSKAMASNCVAFVLLLITVATVNCVISTNFPRHWNDSNNDWTPDNADIAPKSLDIVEKYVATATNLVLSESIEALVSDTIEASEILDSALEVAAEVIDLILSNILDDPTQQEILNELKNIDNKLDVLRYEIEQLLAEISLEISFDQIASQVTQLNNVKGQYSEWLKYANNLTEARTQRFLTSCEENGITDKPNFFYRIFVGNDDVRHPREQVIGFGATKKYRKFASSMVAYLLQASLLSGVCTGLQGNTTDIQVTIRQDAAIYGGYLNQTTSVMISDDLLIKSNFWVNSIHDMDDYLATFYERSHSEFANAFYQHLTDKYDYRQWLVISYGDATFYGTPYHDCWPTPAEQIYNTTDRSTFFYNAVCRKGRNVILASPTKIRPASLPDEFSQASSTCFDNTRIYCYDQSHWHGLITTRTVVEGLKTCTISPIVEPVIRFAFLDQSGFEIVNNSPLAAARWMKIRTYVGEDPFQVDYVSVLIA